RRNLFITLLDFFFQAEDGIRDLIVTGVQTCALPISSDFRWIARCFGIKIDYERGNHSRLVLTAMRGEQNFERLKQRLRLARAFRSEERRVGKECRNGWWRKP